MRDSRHSAYSTSTESEYKSKSQKEHTSEDVPKGTVECRIHHLVRRSNYSKSSPHYYLSERDRESELFG